MRTPDTSGNPLALGNADLLQAFEQSPGGKDAKTAQAYRTTLQDKVLRQKGLTAREHVL